MTFRHIYLLIGALTCLLTSCQGNTEAISAYLDEKADIELRVEDALSRMTLEEKIALIHAQSKFSSPGVPRLGIPEIWCSDGPHGVRAEVLWDQWISADWTNDSCTAYPALTALAATWDQDLAELYGKCIGEEAKYRGKDILLGPGCNILRTPLNGRNFEYLGEDPYLAGRLIVPYIKGVQSNGVAACAKHYALNNNEVNRHTTNVNVSERALHEIYLPAFKAAVQEGDLWAIMGSYNLYKDHWCCHNPYLINEILKGDWGFDGVVLSDWGGAHDTDEAVKNGLDLEYGSWTNGLNTGVNNAYDNYFLAQPYYDGIKSGKYGTDELNDKCRRVLRLIFRTTMSANHSAGRLTCPEHYAAARKIGAESLVLLKNDGQRLPIKTQDGCRILVVGENAIKPMTIGGGSSSLKVQHEISPLDGIISRFGDEAEVVYERGYIGQIMNEYYGISMDVDMSETRSSTQLFEDAVEAASNADYVIYIGGLNKAHHQDGEGRDRLTFDLPYGQNELIEGLAAANQNLIVVNISGNPVSMPWIDKVPVVVQDWYLGSEAGNSLASVLAGDVNPSGKLPFTFPVAYEDTPFRTTKEYPGILTGKKDLVEFHKAPITDIYYTEGIYVGYRWYDKEQIKPLFAFGHGLSYTTFAISQIQLRKHIFDSSFTLKGKIKNTGNRAGAEVVQLYIHDNSSTIDRPEKELKGFRKIYLNPGEEQTFEFTIDDKDLSYYDELTHKWTLEPGLFTALVGNASDNIQQTLEFKR